MTDLDSTRRLLACLEDLAAYIDVDDVLRLIQKGAQRRDVETAEPSMRTDVPLMSGSEAVH